MAAPELQDRIPSCTACEFTFPEAVVPCTGSERGFVVRFLNDQQDVLLWYLYLTRDGEHCVLVSSLSLDEYANAEVAGPVERTRQAIINNTFVCAWSVRGIHLPGVDGKRDLVQAIGGRHSSAQ